MHFLLRIIFQEDWGTLTILKLFSGKTRCTEIWIYKADTFRGITHFARKQENLYLPKNAHRFSSNGGCPRHANIYLKFIYSLKKKRGQGRWETAAPDTHQGSINHWKNGNRFVRKFSATCAVPKDGPS